MSGLEREGKLKKILRIVGTGLGRARLTGPPLFEQRGTPGCGPDPIDIQPATARRRADHRHTPSGTDKGGSDVMRPGGQRRTADDQREFGSHDPPALSFFDHYAPRLVQRIG